MKQEPVLSYGLIVAVVNAGLAMLMSLGVLTLTADQFTAIMLFVNTLAVLGAALVRQYVTPLSNPRDKAGNKLTIEGT